MGYPLYFTRVIGSWIKLCVAGVFVHQAFRSAEYLSLLTDGFALWRIELRMNKYFMMMKLGDLFQIENIRWSEPQFVTKLWNLIEP